MKKTILLSITLFSFLTITAQEFDVRSFEADPSDLSARVYEKRTVNDEPCAIVKVITNISGMQFDSPGIVDVEHKDEGYWLYVAPRERRIRLMASGFLPLDVNLPEPAKELMVYNLVITTKGTAIPTTELVRLAFRINENNVYIRQGNQAPVLSVGNVAVFNLEKGEHNFRFIKEGFDEKTIILDVQDDKDVDIELTPGEVTTPFEPPGFIVVTSEPRGAEVYLNEQRVGVTPYQNSHISGEYSLMLRHPDYHNHYQAFTLEAGASMTIPAIDLMPRYGFYEVTSTPSGAEVLLNNRQVGITPLAKTKISSEYHELTVRYNLYHDHRETFNIEDGDHKQFDIELKPAFGGLRITSEPSGARVFLDGNEVGTTPYVDMRKPSGRYNVRLQKDLYADATETIVVNDEETTERFIPLATNYGSLQVNADGSDIYLDDRRVGRGSYSTDLTPGRYMLKAVKPQHHDDEKEVFIRIGQTESITLSPTPKTGYLSITSKPFEASGAEIWIDGVRQKQTTPAVISLLEGSYEVRLQKEGYADAVERIRVKQDETTSRTFTMLSGKKVTINSEPSGADLYVNNKLVGKTPHAQQINFGRHSLRVVFEGKSGNETIDVSLDGPSSFIVNIEQRLSIQSNPSGAQLHIDGEHVGNTPHYVSLMPGKYKLQLEKRDFITRKSKIKIDAKKNDFTYRLKPHRIIGIGYVFGGDGIKGGFDLFFQHRIHLGFSMMGINYLGYHPQYSYNKDALGYAFTAGYRFVYPLSFSLYTGIGTRGFYSENSDGGDTYRAFIIGAKVPIFFTPNFGIYIKSEYWTKTENSGTFVYSVGIIW